MSKGERECVCERRGGAQGERKSGSKDERERQRQRGTKRDREKKERTVFQHPLRCVSV